MKQSSLQSVLLPGPYLNRFCGIYYLVGFVAKVHNNELEYWEITLSDYSNTVKSYCVEPSCIIGELKPESLVHFEGRLEQGTNGIYIRCKMIMSVGDEYPLFKRFEQLQSVVCKFPKALIQFVGMVNALKSDALRDFLNDVLLQPHVGINYLSCPASLNYHHNYPSGLLEHSVEVASMFAQDGALSPMDKELGIVAALCHDVSKTQTLTASMQRTEVGSLVDHDDLILEICAPGLKKLDVRNADLANQLRHAWTCASPNARYGFKAKTLVAKKLQMYDRESSFLR